jgi:hypothetical protein
MNPLAMYRSLFHLRQDPRPVPPLARRRLIVVAISAVQVAALALITLVSPTFLLLGFATSPAAIWFGRSATRNLTVVSISALDGPQREQVLRAFRSAYGIISAIVLVTGLVLANLDLTLGVEIPPVEFSPIAAALFVLGISTIPWAPVAVLAWWLPDEQVKVTDGVDVHP